jgi:hypothetical protein
VEVAFVSFEPLHSPPAEPSGRAVE